MDSATITWDYEQRAIVYINQTLLPSQCEFIRCTSIDRLALSIQRLEIRGAPALGVAGGYGIALAADRCMEQERERLLAVLRDAALLLRSTRPTAINLSWGIDRVMAAAAQGDSVADIKAHALREAVEIAREDIAMCHQIGKNGAALLPDRCAVLTHCNAGALACVEWGTALGVIRSAAEGGKEIQVYACETRPLNQGSRLTAWELDRDGIAVTVITDATAAFLMRKGAIDAVIVGADRITNDAVFNKIGTYMHAVCARHHNIPFYVAAPYSTFDPGAKEKDITIEERDKNELAFCGSTQLMPEGVAAINYAFDATPLDLVSAIITERGVMKYPF